MAGTELSRVAVRRWAAPGVLAVALLAVALSAVALSAGCGESPPVVDDAPFRTAVAAYLQAHNMAMKLKDIKEAPAVRGDTATMTASLTHEQLGGPSVTWKFDFVRRASGTWEVTRHED